MQTPSSPVIVRIVEPPGELTKLTDVLIGALGLTGVLVLAAAVAAFVAACLVFWFRSRYSTPFPTADQAREDDARYRRLTGE